MPARSKLLSWVLLCVYCSITATEAHLALHRRQGSPSNFRQLFVAQTPAANSAPTPPAQANRQALVAQTHASNAVNTPAAAQAVSSFLRTT
ncbi:hypothetical protein NMY22_g13919 [Coprinellus aureogranulatus]|nr:hypothetical protein NMY22_g13919 [Coprinellus aureogranulatus]